jgi:hypothetical protein
MEIWGQKDQFSHTFWPNWCPQSEQIRHKTHLKLPYDDVKQLSSLPHAGLLELHQCSIPHYPSAQRLRPSRCSHAAWGPSTRCRHYPPLPCSSSRRLSLPLHPLPPCSLLPSSSLPWSHLPEPLLPIPSFSSSPHPPLLSTQPPNLVMLRLGWPQPAYQIPASAKPGCESCGSSL